VKVYCASCSAVWTAISRICHCGACHETFSTVSLFDMHRLRGDCLDPAGLTRGSESKDAGEPLMRRDKRGIWVGYKQRPEVLNDRTG